MRRLPLALCASLALGGAACAQLAGIDQTTGGGDDDDEPSSSLSIERVSIGATVVTAPQPIAGLPLPTFVTGDGGLTGVVSGSNEWTAQGASTGVLFQLPDLTVPPASPMPVERLVSLPVSTIDYPFAVLERPGALPPPDGATVTMQLTVPPVAGTVSYVVADVGAWTSAPLTGPGSDGTTIDETLDYSSFTSQSPEGLLAIGSDDAVLALRYSGARLTGVLDLPGFDQTGADTISGTLVELPDASALDEAVHGPDGAARLAAVTPAPTSIVQSAWSLTAAPGWQRSSTAGVSLDSGIGSAADTTVTATYDNPFVADHDWHTLFAWTLHASRNYTPPSGTFAGVVISGQTRLGTVREPGDGSSADDAALAASLPTSVTLGATLLATDGQEVTEDPTVALPVSFTTDAAGTGDTLYDVAVLEVVTDAATMTPSVATVFDYQGTAPGLTLPANTLLAGHLYWLRVTSIVTTLPGLGDGDLVSGGGPPTSIGATDSAIFTIGAAQ